MYDRQPMPVYYVLLSKALPKLGEDLHVQLGKEVNGALQHLRKALATLWGKDLEHITPDQVKDEVLQRMNARKDSLPVRRELHDLIGQMHENAKIEYPQSTLQAILSHFDTALRAVIGEIMTDAKQKAEKDKPDEKIF